VDKLWITCAPAVICRFSQSQITAKAVPGQIIMRQIVTSYVDVCSLSLGNTCSYRLATSPYKQVRIERVGSSGPFVYLAHFHRIPMDSLCHGGKTVDNRRSQVLDRFPRPPSSFPLGRPPAKRVCPARQQRPARRAAGMRGTPCGVLFHSLRRVRSTHHVHQIDGACYAPCR